MCAKYARIRLDSHLMHIVHARNVSFPFRFRNTGIDTNVSHYHTCSWRSRPGVWPRPWRGYLYRIIVHEFKYSFKKICGRRNHKGDPYLFFGRLRRRGVTPLDSPNTAMSVSVDILFLHQRTIVRGWLPPTIMKSHIQQVAMRNKSYHSKCRDANQVIWK